ncbi:hypothetical protein HUG17_6908 [Dermatophagoides farinae]|uniref:FAD synthase n=2 Tax=Dermatophagoides farinae TaxID=6954 RepID=A0A9D4NRQ0_DERFA|nr:probable FAD synthase [Dermatophagoides farinae]KAH7636702.1 hypothetical protein HUG17_6908 [Dermatophagoides farinae]
MSKNPVNSSTTMPSNEFILNAEAQNMNRKCSNNVQISLEYRFSFYLERSMIDAFQSLLSDLFHQLYPMMINGKPSISYTFTIIECFDYFRNIPTDLLRLYEFDDKFIGNDYDKYSNLIKCQFFYQINSKDSSDDNQDRQKFAWIQAHVRHRIRQLSLQLSLLNDNFLNFLPSIRFDSRDSYRRLKQLAAIDTKVHGLFECCREQIKKVHSDPKRWCLSFNGGKDCTVLLHTLATIHLANLNDNHSDTLINLLWIKTSELFPEQELYLRRIQAFYGCRMNIYPGEDFKSALYDVRKNESFELVFMGCRRTDFDEKIGSTLTTVQPTDEGWPEFIRINPLLDWTYQNVWQFLLNLQVPYCPLYDYGYTSIDRPENTHPNPSLSIRNFPCSSLKHHNQQTLMNDENKTSELSKRIDLDDDDDKNNKICRTNNEEIYLPAYLLRRDDMERCFRH